MLGLHADRLLLEFYFNDTTLLLAVIIVIIIIIIQFLYFTGYSNKSSWMQATYLISLL
jgi:hypothetical protein